MSVNLSLKELYSRMNKNAKLVMGFTLLNSLGRGIWLGNVISAYIYFLADESNKVLGITSSITGFALTIVVFPAGYLSDKYRRDSLLKFAAFFGIIALILTAMATTIPMIMVALLFWGIAQGLTRPSLEALFADSVETGARSQIYSIKHFIQQVGMAIGPFLNIGLFFILGDVWDLVILRTVMSIGLIISGFSLIPLLLLSDEGSIGEDSEAHAEAIEPNGDKTEYEESKSSNSKIPYLLVASNVIVGIGAGMTVRFFPIFFLDVYDLNPIPVNTIMAFVFIFTGASGVLAQKLSLNQGRAKTIFLVQLIATIFLFVIATYPPLILLIPLFLLRGSLMNSAQPLSRSILMDYIPKNRRGIWNSFEAIAWGLFWNISAILGGYLIEAFSYRFCFLVTASIYLFASIPILFLIPLVPTEKGTELNQNITSKIDTQPTVGK